MILNINSEINNEVFDKLVKAYNELKDHERLIIYFSTPGGSVGIQEAIIDIINTNCDITTLIAYDEICSAGFSIFFRTQCSKGILDQTTGMAHFTGVNVNYLDSNQPSGEDDRFYMRWTREAKEKFLNFCRKIGMSEKELKALKQGKDVWLSTDRLYELMKKN